MIKRLFFRCRITNLECFCLSQSLLYVRDRPHLGILICLDGNGHQLLVFWRHSLLLGTNIVHHFGSGGKLIIELYLRILAILALQILGWFADIDMAHGTLLGESGEMLALRHTAFYLQGNLAHMGNYHEEEENREYQVWQG